METVWPAIFTFLGVYTFAIVSPGPNFFLVTNTAMTRSRNEGLFISLGVASGSGIFAFAGLIGILPMVHSLPFFADIMRFAGGGYLLWIGVEMVLECRREKPAIDNSKHAGESALMSYRVGLVTNLTNPKAWAFYLSLFALVIGTPFPAWSKLYLNIAMFLISLCWYTAMALLISSRTFQPLFLTCRPLIQGSLGVMLIGVAAKIIWVG